MTKKYEIINKKIRSIIDKTLIKLRIRGVVTALRSLYILEFKEGHFLSSTIYQSVDGRGNPIPWFPYPAISYFKDLDLNNKTIFEYGSGNSSLFWAPRCKELVSVEHDPKWHQLINDKLKMHKNVKYLLRTSKKDYLNSIFSLKKDYDVIIVDGEWRKECAQKAVKKIAAGGIIVLDNSDWFPNICKILKKHKFSQVDFKGFAPQNPYLSTTSIFFRDYDFQKAK